MYISGHHCLPAVKPEPTHQVDNGLWWLVCAGAIVAAAAGLLVFMGFGGVVALAVALGGAGALLVTAGFFAMERWMSVDQGTASYDQFFSHLNPKPSQGGLQGRTKKD